MQRMVVSVLLFAFLAGAVAAQTTSTEVPGTVPDPTGAVAERRHTTTDSTADCSLPFVLTSGVQYGNRLARDPLAGGAFPLAQVALKSGTRLAGPLILRGYKGRDKTLRSLNHEYSNFPALLTPSIRGGVPARPPAIIYDPMTVRPFRDMQDNSNIIPASPINQNAPDLGFSEKPVSKVVGTWGWRAARMLSPVGRPTFRRSGVFFLS